MTTASIARTGVLSRPAKSSEERGNPARGAGNTPETPAGTAGPGIDLKTAARRRGLTMKEFAARVGVTPGYLSGIASGRRQWTARMREKVEAALEETPERGFVYRRRPPASGESSYIRERARAMGMSMRDLAERVGVTPGYLTEVSRGRRTMGVKVEARVEVALGAPAKVAPAKLAAIDRKAVWDRMDAHGLSQNEAARRAGVSPAHLSNIMAGRSTPSPKVMRRLHGVLFRRSERERVVPAEVRVMGWRKGRRHGLVVRGAGGPGGSVRAGGHVPWGAEVEYAFRTGYDGRGRVSVEHVVEMGYSSMLTQAEAA